MRMKPQRQRVTVIALASLGGLAVALAGCSGGGAATVASTPQPKAPQSASATAAAASNAPREAQAVSVEPPSGTAVDALAIYGWGRPDGWGAFWDSVVKTYPFTTEDEAASFGGFAMGMCMAADQLPEAGLSADVIVASFQDEYGIAITPTTANAIRDNFRSACNE